MPLTALSIAISTPLTLRQAEEYLDLLQHIHELGIFQYDIADIHAAILNEAESQRLDPRLIAYRVLREVNRCEVVAG